MNFITGYIPTKIGNIPQVSTNLEFFDYLGTVKVRWGIYRDNYRVEPGIYATGTPNEYSDVFVTANYKLSFDALRKNLSDINAWILVLDTKGINVWCAAGKGTFGTKELVNRIELTSLAKIINHKRLILPQLGAPGVSAHKVKEFSGFNVIYGPIRATDIKPFIKEHYKASKEMRRVTFNFYERLRLIPVDLMYRINYLLGILALVFLLSGINSGGISFQQSIEYGLPASINIILGYLSGIVLTPILLPFIPVRSFAMKGFITGAILSVILYYYEMFGTSTLGIISWFLLITGVSSFIAMNFTGSSTFTSLSGVKKEMKYAVPVQITLVSCSLILVIINIMF